MKAVQIFILAYFSISFQAYDLQQVTVHMLPDIFHYLTGVMRKSVLFT